MTLHHAVLVAACDTLDDTTDTRCPGTIRFRWGQPDAPCSRCGARCGIAVARWLRVETPPPMFVDRYYVPGLATVDSRREDTS